MRIVNVMSGIPDFPPEADPPLAENCLNVLDWSGIPDLNW